VPLWQIIIGAIGGLVKMKILNQLLDLFFPNFCFVCREKLTDNQFICKKCLNELAFLDTKKCFYCGINPAENGICEHCRNELPFDGLVSVFKFNNVIQVLIHNLKYNEFKKIGKFLGKFLAERLSHYNFISDIDFVVPVPLHKVKKRERGFNQSFLIAKEVSNQLHIPIGEGLIIRKEYTKTQIKLNREEREKNVGNAFFVKRPDLVEGRKILLIDDVLTTGSTMKSMTKTLKESGAGKVYASSLARA
jgi:ComF family protein